MRRKRLVRCGWWLLLAAVSLAGCARPQPPIEIGPLPRAQSAPKWLPAGWVRYEPRPQLAPERDLVQWFAPDGATAPLVAYCRYTPDEVRRLAAKQGPDVAAAMLARLRRSFAQRQVDHWSRRVTLEGVWPRPEAVGGRWIDVDSMERDDRSGALHGRLAVAGTRSGALVVVGVLLPTGADGALITQVLEAVPLD